MSSGAKTIVPVVPVVPVAPVVAGCKCGEPLSNGTLWLFKIGAGAAAVLLGLKTIQMYYRRKRKGEFF
ncbi:MAG: hypothetical protein Harvfovirus6_27 [Harvfovirus sp.]|uniref:Uncharacterized protein n=1 Tax=Harvfovirus sp. TaxID=2487768 RepID=A0A3G5A0Q9_9VIRU|nr:MAG: hypothetical protein Harvfovirus6_27 [Harvfovirus sp.]